MEKNETETLKYRVSALEQQTEMLTQALNEVRAKNGLDPLRMPERFKGAVY